MATINNPFGTDEVVGVAPSERADEVVEALRSTGFEIDVLRGPGDASDVDVDGDGVAAKFIRFFQEGEEKDTLRDFRQRLEQGDSVIRIVEVGDRADEAGKVFVDHGGETIWHYGKWTYEKLHD